jgi:hypothetical protein
MEKRRMYRRDTVVDRWRHSATRAMRRLAALFRKAGPPEDPYAYVMAPKKPRPPYLSAAAVAERPE